MEICVSVNIGHNCLRSAVDRLDGRDRFVSFDLVVVVAPFTDDCLLLLLPLLRLPWLAEDRVRRSGAARRPFLAKICKKAKAW